MANDPEFPADVVELLTSIVAVRLCAPGQRPNHTQSDMAHDIALSILRTLRERGELLTPGRRKELELAAFEAGARSMRAAMENGARGAAQVEEMRIARIRAAPPAKIVPPDEEDLTWAQEKVKEIDAAPAKGGGSDA